MLQQTFKYTQTTAYTYANENSYVRLVINASDVGVE
jgi:hypothetical protein